MTTTIAKGLEGVLFTETKLTFINGSEGILTHLGIPIQEWAEKSTFEELSFALLHGRLPGADELARFDAELRANREVPAELLSVIAAYPKGVHPMQALRTAVSHLSLFDAEAEDTAAEDRYRIGVRMIAQFSTIIAAIARAQDGQEIVAPRADLTHAGNFLYMLKGSEPTAEEARLFDIALILHADHGMNASTFTAIATASTLSDMYSAMTSAIGALKGPLHGGANEAVMDMLDEIGSVENAVPYISEKLDHKEKIMGVGHRVYKFFDPRSRVLRDYAAHVSEKQGKSHYYQILETIEKEIVDRLGSKGIYPNVDFYSGVVYSDLGIKKSFFTPIFALARISGWVASVMEYTANNRLLRPDAVYAGAKDQTYPELSDRQ
ncbi:citrate/2-methylcitrate synthase [Deinococcus peraridilitoris]|uniref:Citrate synthase n=1 Tax=Deinococcus peraridilitoris (strain DSM 19664 / LMG 22246 / CIP 109416 / KR-200) TaxID=937777 RepID=L0A7S3_DEIPD|nr:citrate/2-methylcitrate synthase [Deinococcus peraridilitoris]AFZ69227.1 2-methylcitrate synthase/citrate synthase II [Deinococcus peraridilitoris DSM 19664]